MNIQGTLTWSSNQFWICYWYFYIFLVVVRISKQETLSTNSSFAFSLCLGDKFKWVIDFFYREFQLFYGEVCCLETTYVVQQVKSHTVGNIFFTDGCLILIEWMTYFCCYFFSSIFPILSLITLISRLLPGKKVGKKIC